MKRLEQILNVAGEAGCDAVVFTDAINRRYASGYNAADGLLVITKQRSCMFVDFRYNDIQPENKMVSPDELPEIIVTNSPMLEAANELLNSADVKKVAIDTATVTYDLFMRISNVLTAECVATPGLCVPMRSIKSEYELEQIKKAQSITDAAFDYVLGKINPDMTENELAAELEYFIRRKGGGIAFETIAVSGTQSAIPHGTPRDVRLTMNSFITMDFGATWNGYCSDMTRTVVLGKADDEMKKVYNTVLKAQKIGIEAAKAGIAGSVVDIAAREYIASCGYGDYFTHSYGHGVGLEIHEAPNFSRLSTKIIPENAVLTAEPGIYLPKKFGVRIEDLLIIKENGYENITNSRKDLIEL